MVPESKMGGSTRPQAVYDRTCPGYRLVSFAQLDQMNERQEWIAGQNRDAKVGAELAG